MNIKVFGANASVKEKLIRLSDALDKKCDFLDFDNLSNQGPLLIVVLESSVDTINDYLVEIEANFLLVFEKRKDLELLKKLNFNPKQFFGFVDLSLDEIYNQPIINNFVAAKMGLEKSNLESLSKDLDKILSFTQDELERVKKLHEKTVKMRTEKLKGATLYLKFMAGEKSGGEFFDYAGSGQDILMIQLGSQSYVASSMMLTEVEEFKKRNNFTEESIVALTKKIVKIGEESNSSVNYMITLFNFHRLELNYFQRGKSKLFQGDSLLNIEGNGKMRLKPGNKLFFISEGFLKNALLNMKESDFHLLFKEHEKHPTKELINELFFELYKNKKGTFLEYDALLCAIEVDSNAIFEV